MQFFYFPISFVIYLRFWLVFNMPSGNVILEVGSQKGLYGVTIT